MSEKPSERPVAWKNTFFWLGAILLGVAIVGFVTGDRTIRDPGQVDEGGLSFFYLIGGLLMILNGWLTHVQALRHHDEQSGRS